MYDGPKRRISRTKPINSSLLFSSSQPHHNPLAPQKEGYFTKTMNKEPPQFPPSLFIVEGENKCKTLGTPLLFYWDSPKAIFYLLLPLLRHKTLQFSSKVMPLTILVLLVLFLFHNKYYYVLILISLPYPFHSFSTLGPATTMWGWW